MENLMKKQEITGDQNYTTESKQNSPPRKEAQVKILPMHIRFLENVFLKFGLLSLTQVGRLFEGRLKRRGVYYCLAQLVKEKKIIWMRGLKKGDSIYMITKHAFGGLHDQYISPKQSFCFSRLAHRLACNEVALACYGREYVSGLIMEHELYYENNVPKIYGRRPDGFITISRPERIPIDVAIEVETTQRNRSRIESVIQIYVNSFVRHPDLVSGVIIIAVTPVIANAYRQAIQKFASSHPKRFVVSERLDVTDVQETILGRAIPNLSDHPLKLLESCNPMHLKSN
jgi:hypothetical protein